MDEGWRETLIPGPHPPSEKAPLSRRDRVILSMMDSATPPCGCPQNFSIVGGIQVSDGNERSLQSFTCGASSTHPTLPVCEQHENRGGIYVIEHFPS